MQLRRWQRSANWVASNPLESNPRVNSLVNDSIVELLGELQDRRPHNSPSPPSTYHNNSDIEMDAPQSDHEFLQTQDPTHYSVSFNDSDTTQLQASALDMAISQLAEELESFLFNDFESESSEDDLEERDPEFFAEVLLTTDEIEQDPVSFGQRCPRMKPSHANPEWFPWPDKAACILDLFRHLPRGIFSEAQMEIVTWALSAFGINNVPSVDVMKSVDDYLQSLCGIHTVHHQGALGHIYYMNDLAGIIRQEMANPRVRQHIHHYHEDSGRHLEHAWQAEAWRDLDPDLATPMVRMGHQDYYVYEVTHLETGDLVIPHRWFTRRHKPGSEQQDLYCMAWKLDIDHGAQGYIVCKWDQVQVPVTSLLASLPHISESFELDGGYDPRKIIGVQKQPNEGLLPWTHTNWDTGSLNPWRIKAKNHRVLTFAMWVYCDDTSGNVSKKWNKHNSFLFTAAGLPREHVHRQSNIHFLSTSNLAPPLEMLDGFVDQLEAGQKHGIWAWDIEAKEMVLLIPAVLAMLGDNPMQSEFACHVGLTGKFFCRCCWAKGRDAEDEGPLPSQTPSTRASPIPSPSHIPATDTSSIHSDAGSEKSASGKRRRRIETLSQLKERAKRFLEKHQLRTPDDTKKTLKSIFTKSSTINGKTEAKQMMTQFGVKDTFLDHFRDKVLSFISKLPRGTAREEKQRETDKYVKEELPDDVYSPVWRIKGFDPHRDTPVEILHVILLGFVKYYWRDAMTRLSDEQKMSSHTGCPPSMSLHLDYLLWQEKHLSSMPVLCLDVTFA
ncbi:hypothetical protein BT96DRAFT_949810 [Gymnopus androsaceus JB14]|uniref:Uncharacterized protein n=1 Tax=Gymnopus androsaceus JB14 TaxID=1447944 RepID=A0A6A4GJJ5_9AGAR|nr:hypothetical protein BT96DRAFT_949810 [Gymnopus androsaceus JB14]